MVQPPATKADPEERRLRFWDDQASESLQLPEDLALTESPEVTSALAPLVVPLALGDAGHHHDTHHDKKEKKKDP